MFARSVNKGNETLLQLKRSQTSIQRATITSLSTNLFHYQFFSFHSLFANSLAQSGKIKGKFKELTIGGNMSK